MSEYVKPFDGEMNLARKDLAKYFNRVGRGVNCRMDVPVLVISDIKWAAKVFGDLSKTLTDLGWEDERSDIWRVLAARYAMESARAQLAQRNEQKTSLKLARETKDRRRA